jgi:hypothetical protein
VSTLVAIALYHSVERSSTNLKQDIGLPDDFKESPSKLDWLTIEEVRINFSKLLPFFWDCRLFKDSCNRTCRFTGTTVNAFIGVYIKQFSLFKTSLACCRMDAIDGANIYAGSVFYPNARLSDNIGHVLDILLLVRCVIIPLHGG